ncbi:hypothetical protein RF11_12486 [Thelohanellus kitauei]|uniref:Uncharacterized protein n=1 Tax=Thelohanellus kitauei TaxID=669202 RepID=A0A0C2J782_THEKT|nr:hypothetical protein RF11_12486 [Thelohanellus kitauei]
MGIYLEYCCMEITRHRPAEHEIICPQNICANGSWPEKIYHKLTPGTTEYEQYGSSIPNFDTSMHQSPGKPSMSYIEGIEFVLLTTIGMKRKKKQDNNVFRGTEDTGNPSNVTIACEFWVNKYVVREYVDLLNEWESEKFQNNLQQTYDLVQGYRDLEKSIF